MKCINACHYIEKLMLTAIYFKYYAIFVTINM